VLGQPKIGKNQQAAPVVVYLVYLPILLIPPTFGTVPPRIGTEAYGSQRIGTVAPMCTYNHPYSFCLLLNEHAPAGSLGLYLTVAEGVLLR
jgi:hypothetical protein